MVNLIALQISRGEVQEEVSEEEGRGIHRKPMDILISKMIPPILVKTRQMTQMQR
jgi:hypothetical protein